MKFEYDGREFDTDKPICVLGYTILSWFAYHRGHEGDVNSSGKVKKFYVQEMRFKFNGDKNVIKSMKLISLAQDDSIIIDEENIIGHSPKECMKLYRERCGGTEV